MKKLDWYITICALLIIFFAGCSWMFKGVGGGEPIVKTGGQQLTSATNKIGWLPFLSIIGIGLSVAAWYNGSSKALGGAAGCGVMLGLSLAVVKYSGWIAGGSIVVGLIFMVISLLDNKKGVSFEKLLSKVKGKK